MTTEDKFKAAVNVIRNLPKEGSYVPSNELQLRFYGFFKQAINGPNNEAKPAFWDVVGRAKWNAWNVLGDMQNEAAMEGYVELLMSIVETMSYNQTVDAFLESVGSFYQSVDSDHVDLVLGPVIAKIKSQKQVQEQVKKTEPNDVPKQVTDSGGYQQQEACHETAIVGNETIYKPKVIQDNVISDDEEYCDTIATTPLASRKIDLMPKKSIEQYEPISIESCSNSTNHSGTFDVLQTKIVNLEEKIELIAEQYKMIHLVLSRISQVLLADFRNGVAFENVKPASCQLARYYPVKISAFRIYVDQHVDAPR